MTTPHDTVRMLPAQPAVVINAALLRTLWTIVRATDGEVSGLGEIDFESRAGLTELHVGRNFTPEVRQLSTHTRSLALGDVFYLLDQSGSAALTELDPEALTQLMFDFQETGRSASKLAFWFHSHVKMGAFFSWTDDDTIKDLAKQYPTVVAGVFNHYGETEWRLVHEGAVTDWKLRIPGKPPTAAEIEPWIARVKAVVRPRTTLWSRVGGYLGPYTWRDEDSRKSKTEHDSALDDVESYHDDRRGRPGFRPQGGDHGFPL